MRKLLLTIISLVSLSPFCWGEDVFVKNKFIDVHVTSGSSGSSTVDIHVLGESTLAVGTGTTSGFGVPASSPTSGLNFDQTQFNVMLPAGTTPFIQIKSSILSSGGASTLAVATGTTSGFGVPVSSPTAVLNFNKDLFSVTLPAGSTPFITILPTTVTMQGPVVSSITLAAMYGSPTLNGANITNIQGAQVGSGVPAANIASGSLGSSVIASSITLAAMYGSPTLNAANITNIQGAQVGSGVPAANIASGSLGSQVIASSITLAAMYGAPTLTGTNFTSLPGAQVGSGVPAANIAAGSLGATVIASSITQAAMYGSPTFSGLVTGGNFQGSNAVTAYGNSGSAIALTQSASSTTFNVPIPWDYSVSYLDNPLGTNTTYYVAIDSIPAYGAIQFANGTSSTTNCGMTKIWVPRYASLSTDPTLEGFGVWSGGVEVSTQSYTVYQSTVPTSKDVTKFGWKNGAQIQVGAPATSATFGATILSTYTVTLTNWAAGFNPGEWNAVEVCRNGDNTVFDPSTTTSYGAYFNISGWRK